MQVCRRIGLAALLLSTSILALAGDWGNWQMVPGAAVSFRFRHRIESSTFFEIQFENTGQSTRTLEYEIVYVKDGRQRRESSACFMLGAGKRTTHGYFGSFGSLRATRIRD